MKVRPIDNYKSNGANDMTVSCERTENDREDVISQCILELQRSLHDRGRDEQVLIGLEDFVGAFRTLAPDQGQRWLMHLLVYNTDEDEWMVAELVAMPFGAIGGVLAWWRTASALKSIARRLCKLLIFIYVDDTHLVDVCSTATEAKQAFQTMMNLLGWELDGAKSVPMCKHVRSLGSELCIKSEGLSWSVCADKKRTWQQSIEDALRNNSLTPGEASKLHGRLNFGAQKVFARTGRAMLRPISHRQRQPNARELGTCLRNALTWWHKFLQCEPCSTRDPWDGDPGQADILLYTDAEGAGVATDLRVSSAQLAEHDPDISWEGEDPP